MTLTNPNHTAYLVACNDLRWQPYLYPNQETAALRASLLAHENPAVHAVTPWVVIPVELPVMPAAVMRSVA